MNDVQWGLSPWTLAPRSDSLPPHCTPTSPFLHQLSALLHTCIPTPLALLSTVFGCLSIVSWLFAQLPQVLKNFRLRSASGLSIYFLVEWCLGDISNLSGALLTNQATWQIIVAAYYCFVDIMLVGQWLWYEQLQHGRPLKSVWLRKYRSSSSFGRNSDGDIVESAAAPPTNEVAAQRSARQQTIANSLFHEPDYDHSRLSPRTASWAISPNTSSSIIRDGPPSSLPSPSPRTLLMLATILALASRGLASPTARYHSEDAIIDATATATAGDRTSYAVGVGLSWLSTLLYLGSRLPQIVKNARLRSTAGLSPLLFLAAFGGNLFYSASMAVNPLAWSSFGPYGGHGWAPAEGSEQEIWVAGALPFFLGAAGVLLLDASVGLQFWLFRERSDEEVVVVVDDDDSEGNESKGMVRGVRRGVRRVSGWMRGWVPGLGMSSPQGSLSRAGPEGGERRALLDGHLDEQRGSRSYGGT